MSSPENPDSSTLTPAFDSCWQKAIEAANSGDYVTAETWFRQCVEQAPDHHLAALNLGVLLANRKNYAESIQYLDRAVQLSSSLDSVFTLASTLQRAGKAEDAQRYFTDILNSVPTHVPTLMQMGELCEQSGDRHGARGYYRQARDADDKDLVVAKKYAIASWEDDPAETAAVLDQQLARSDLDDTGRAKIILDLIIYKEFHERIKRGLMPYHATSLDELFFTYTKPEFSEFCSLAEKAAEKNPTDPTAQTRKFIAHFCSSDRLGAQKCLEHFRTAVAGHVWDTVTFDPNFYRALESFTKEDLLKGLPPVENVIYAEFSEEPVAYLSCNYIYFENFAAPMLRSLADVASNAQAHVHIMDATPQQLDLASSFCRSLDGLTIALSVEQPGADKNGMAAARSYYHAIRFIRYYQHLEQYRRTLWLMDVDALFNRDPKAMYDVLGGMDAAMRIRAGRLEPWNQFNACIVAATASSASLEYFRLIAAYIAHFYQRDGLRWGIDQLAMYGVFEYMRDEGYAPDLAFLDDKAIDYEYLDDGIVWCNSGRNKFLHMQRNPDGSMAIDDPDRAAYIKLFDKYYSPLSA